MGFSSGTERSLFTQFPFNYAFLLISESNLKIKIDMQDIGVCYAFVEFEDLQAVQNAIKVWILFF